MLTLLTTGFVLLVSGAVAGCILHGALLGRIRAGHPDIWAALGTPDRVFDDGGLGALRAVRELYQRPDLQLQCSSEIRAMFKYTRLFSTVYLVFAGIVLAALVANFWSVL